MLRGLVLLFFLRLVRINTLMVTIYGSILKISCMLRPRPGMYRYSMYSAPKSSEPHTAFSGRQRAKMTSAMASQPRSPKPLLVQVPPEYSMTKYNPPRPAMAPPMTVARYLYSETLMPAASAVAGLSPTARSARPWRVRFRNQDR